MAQIEMIMPKMGESVAEATITKWLKSEGDTVEADESVLEIATDKVDSEVPAPSSGTIAKVLFSEGDVVKVGEVIAILSTSSDVQSEAKATSKAEEQNVAQVANAEPPKPVVEKTVAHGDNGSGRFYSPLVKNIASKEGIGINELETISGTGSAGRVTKKDILGYLADRGSKKEDTNSGTGAQVSTPAEPSKVNVIAGPDEEVIEMDRMRKLIAEHMVRSKQTSPHVTSYVEADVTNIVIWRNKIKSEFQKREGGNFTFTPVFIEAAARAVRDFPMINISVDGTKIIRKNNINIGMAAALPSGNLIVPVIKNADRMNLLGLAKTVNDFAARARSNQLKPDEIQGGTFTITNVGTFGNVMGTPIINQPQVAILATGAIRKKPAVVETEYGDAIAIRHLMYLSLSYDHRVVDGSLGGSFLRRVADILEGFDPNRSI